MLRAEVSDFSRSSFVIKTSPIISMWKHCFALTTAREQMEQKSLIKVTGTSL